MQRGNSEAKQAKERGRNPNQTYSERSQRVLSTPNVLLTSFLPLDFNALRF